MTENLRLAVGSALVGVALVALLWGWQVGRRLFWRLYARIKYGSEKTL